MEKTRLLDQARNVMHAKHSGIRTELSCIQWIKRFIYFHLKQHPVDTGETEIPVSQSHLTINKHVTSPSQNQALSALLFLYRQVPGHEPGEIDAFVRAG